MVSASATSGSAPIRTALVSASSSRGSGSALPSSEVAATTAPDKASAVATPKCPATLPQNHAPKAIPPVSAEEYSDNARAVTQRGAVNCTLMLNNDTVCILQTPITRNAKAEI